MRITTKDGKLFLSLINEEMQELKKTWPQPVEIDKRWLPFLVEDCANANLELWKIILKEEYGGKNKR